MIVFKVVDVPYTNDVEIDDKGRVVFLRDFEQGETVLIPLHMLGRIAGGDYPAPRYSAKS